MMMDPNQLNSVLVVSILNIVVLICTFIFCIIIMSKY